MILFHYPPIGGSGPHRNATVVRLLEERGWDPVVLTVARWPSALRDPSIPHRPSSIRVNATDPAAVLAPLRRLGAGRLASLLERTLFFPDRTLLWAIRALPAALAASRRCDAIYTSSPPESAHLLGALVKRLTGRPWIADFRTEWSENPGYAFPAGWVRALHRALEHALLRRADHILTLSPSHTERLREILGPAAPASTVVVGWNPAEARPPELPQVRTPTVVAYAGVFSDVRRIDPFIDAVELAIDRGWLPRGSLKLTLLGSAWEAGPALARTRMAVQNLGRVPRTRVIESLREADWLLLTLDPSARRWIPNKMYEYAAAGRPILAVVPPDGDTARWVRETRTGFVIPASPVEAAARALSDLLGRWSDGHLEWTPDAARLDSDGMPRVGDRLDRLLRASIPAPRPRRKRGPRVAVFFTYGYSLQLLKDSALLERELELYHALARDGATFNFLTYDRIGAIPQVRLPPQSGLHPMTVTERISLHSLLAPLIHRDALRRANILRINQMRGGYTAALAKLLYGKKLYVRTGYVLSVFDREANAPPWVRWIGRATERLAYSLADAWSITTAAQKRYIERAYRPRARGVVIPNFVDVSRFRQEPGLARPRSVCFVGRLAAQKNLESLIDALEGLDAELTLIGGGPLRADLERRADERGVRARFLGHIPNEALHRRLVEHEVFAFPSHYESFGKALLESMACGLAVVTSDFFGVREMVRDGVNGLIVAPDVPSIRAALRRLLDDPELRRRLGREARRTAEVSYSLDGVARAEREIYDGLLAP